MKVCFLYPATDTRDALEVWVATLARHCKGHQVRLGLHVKEVTDDDVVLALTQREVYPQDRIDADLLMLRKSGVPFGVVHNQDDPAVPSPGGYPSFVWTYRSWEKLRSRSPVLVRMPVLPQCTVAQYGFESKYHVATFGRCEPKKHVVQMARWCQREKVPFTAFTPGSTVEANGDYIDRVRKVPGAQVCVHPWAEKVEDLHYLFAGVSHFLFVLPPGKSRPGGSPTSCRYATAFGRPVVVVDDEGTYSLDGFTVARGLDDLTADDLRRATLPNYDWLPEAYVDRLARLTLAHWGKGVM